MYEAQHLSSVIANIPGFQHREKMGTLSRAPFLASAKSEEKHSARKHASIVSEEKQAFFFHFANPECYLYCR